jgi:hypothetical protein
MMDLNQTFPILLFSATVWNLLKNMEYLSSDNKEGKRELK